MRLSAMLAVFIALSACSKGASEEKKYRTMEKSELSKHTGELCTQARRVAAGYLDDGDEQKYSYWQLIAFNDCRF